MKKQKFNDILSKMQKSMDFELKLYNEFHIETESLPTSDACGWLFDTLFQEILTEEGFNIFSSYFFDYLNTEPLESIVKKNYKKPPFIINNTEIKSYDDMYDFLLNNNMFKITEK